MAGLCAAGCVIADPLPLTGPPSMQGRGAGPLPGAVPPRRIGPSTGLGALAPGPPLTPHSVHWSWERGLNLSSVSFSHLGRPWMCTPPHQQPPPHMASLLVGEGCRSCSWSCSHLHRLLSTGPRSPTHPTPRPLVLEKEGYTWVFACPTLAGLGFAHLHTSSLPLTGSPS